MNKIEGLIKEVPKEGIVKARDVKGIRYLQQFLSRENVEKIINENSYDMFLDKIMDKLNDINSFCASKKVIEEFLLTVINNNEHFSHIGDDIFEVFSGRKNSIEQIENFGFDFQSVFHASEIYKRNERNYTDTKVYRFLHYASKVDFIEDKDGYLSFSYYCFRM